jgi:hypothetical protein
MRGRHPEIAAHQGARSERPVQPVRAVALVLGRLEAYPARYDLPQRLTGQGDIRLKKRVELPLLLPEGLTEPPLLKLGWLLDGEALEFLSNLRECCSACCARTSATCSSSFLRC